MIRRLFQQGPVVCLLLGTFAVSGCRPAGVEVYSVPKEVEPPPPDHDHAPRRASQPMLSWKVPANWEEQPADRFRVASFKVTGGENQQAEISVVPLPGTAGGDLSNVNRWREQAGLPPLAEEELPAAAEPLTIADQPADLYDQAGADLRILGVIQQRDGAAWFYKMTGHPQLVADQKATFLAFLGSVRFEMAPPPAAPPVASQPTAGPPRWQPPAHWEAEAPGQFLVAKFRAGEATVNISSSAGDGGGLTANVNRWRRQLGLAELGAAEIKQSATITTAGATIVELAGDTDRVIAAVVSRPGQTWFYKLTGPTAAVTAEESAFHRFVEGVDY